MKIRVAYSEMKSVFSRILEKEGFNDNKAERCALIFTQNSLEGVYSHGVNRFPRFVDNIRKGYVCPDAEPCLVRSLGALEQWDGNLGPGPLNAFFATERATEIAALNGIGLVALANTNHWMRGGTYGWQAARLGYVFIGWTNTEANMPAWGGKDTRLGNNPLVIAVPYGNEAVVLDFAMSQYSYGKMEMYSLEKLTLPFPGGYNKRGDLSTDPGEILETRRTIPAGYWKGSGLSLLLDMLAAVLSGGLSAAEISRKEAEYSLSQIFIAISLQELSNYGQIPHTVDQIINDIKGSVHAEGVTEIRYPGENVVRTREENMIKGIPVNSEIWEKIVAM